MGDKILIKHNIKPICVQTSIKHNINIEFEVKFIFTVRFDYS